MKFHVICEAIKNQDQQGSDILTMVIPRAKSKSLEDFLECSSNISWNYVKKLKFAIYTSTFLFFEFGLGLTPTKLACKMRNVSHL